MPQKARFSFVRGVSDFKLLEEKGFPAGLRENVRTEDQSTETRRSMSVATCLKLKDEVASTEAADG